MTGADGKLNGTSAAAVDGHHGDWQGGEEGRGRGGEGGESQQQLAPMKSATTK